MFETRDPIHAQSRFFRSAVASPIASGPWKEIAGEHPANTPRNTAHPISRGEARSLFASFQSSLSFSQSLRSKRARD